MNGKDKRNTSGGLVELQPALFISFAACFMLFIFAPLELYCNNIREFWFDFKLVFSKMLIAFVAMLALSVLMLALIRLISRRLYRLCLSVYTVCFLSTYIQGNFFSGYLPWLDGSQIDWSVYSGQRLVSIGIWLTCTAIAVGMWLLAKKRKGTAESYQYYCGYICGAVSLVLVLTLAAEIVMSGAARYRKYSLSTDNEMEASSDKACIVLILDSVDAQMLDRVLEAHPEYYEAFKDFSYYSDAAACYPMTDRAIPMIASGDWYENDEPYDEWLLKAYTKSPLAKKLKDEGWRVSYYTSCIPDDNEFCSWLDNAYETNSCLSSSMRFIKLQLRLVGFKYAPFDLKKFFVFEMADFDSIRADENNPVYFDYVILSFFDKLKGEEISVKQEKVYKFIHLDGAHDPYNLCIENDEIVEDKYAEDSFNEVDMSMYVAWKYIEKLKQAGTYDNTALVIMSDHGLHPPESDLLTDKKVFLYRADAVFLAKGIGEEHERLQVNNKPISFAEASSAFIKLMDGRQSDELFETDYENIARRYLPYKWYDNGKPDHILYEYECVADASDTDSFIETGRIYPEFSK